MRFLLFFISFPFLSRIWGKITGIKSPRFLSKFMISAFKKHYKIEMDRFEGSEFDYPSLKSFFVRKLDYSKVKLLKDDTCFLSPCDGKITKIETISKDETTLVKGKSYKISELLKKDLDFSEEFVVATIYLSPHDYHRFHFPVDCSVLDFCHTGARLFPVNSVSVHSIDNLFVKNERIVSRLRFKDSEMYYVAVGATFVGSLKMVFIENNKHDFDKWIEVNKEFAQNEEAGMFEMGSTIVLVIPKKNVGEVLVEENNKIKVGEKLFKLK